MLTQAQVDDGRSYAAKALRDAGIVITSEEAAGIEVSDFGLGDLERTGLQLVVYVNTERVCAKDLVLRPRQICPEHRHVGHDGELGKEETFRVRTGLVHLYIEGQHMVLRPGEQYTVYPDTLHWFQAGDDGAVVSEFSTRSTDESDVFTDPDIRRITVVEG